MLNGHVHVGGGLVSKAAAPTDLIRIISDVEDSYGAARED
jgi:hypothetical protein